MAASSPDVAAAERQLPFGDDTIEIAGCIIACWAIEMIVFMKRTLIVEPGGDACFSVAYLIIM